MCVVSCSISERRGVVSNSFCCNAFFLSVRYIEFCLCIVYSHIKTQQTISHSRVRNMTFVPFSFWSHRLFLCAWNSFFVLFEVLMRCNFEDFQSVFIFLFVVNLNHFERER